MYILKKRFKVSFWWKNIYFLVRSLKIHRGPFIIFIHTCSKSWTRCCAYICIWAAQPAKYCMCYEIYIFYSCIYPFVRVLITRKNGSPGEGFGGDCWSTRWGRYIYPFPLSLSLSLQHVGTKQVKRSVNIYRIWYFKSVRTPATKEKTPILFFFFFGIPMYV